MPPHRSERPALHSPGRLWRRHRRVNFRAKEGSLPEKVAAFVEKHGCLFQQPWWLDAVCVPPWSWEYLWIEKGQEVVAAWPLPFKTRLGLRLLEMPPPTPYLGPILRPSTAKYGNRLGEEKDLLTSLLDQLPPFASFAQHLPPGFQNWLPFHWRGFSQSSHVTYVIPSLADLDAVWNETLDRVRTDVRKAEKTVTVTEGTTDDFLNLYRLTFARQSDTPHVPGEIIRRTVNACLARSCGRLLIARDASGRAHAGCFVVWDTSSAYYLLGGADPELRNSGAGSLTLWRAIQFAATLGSKQEAVSREQSSKTSPPLSALPVDPSKPAPIGSGLAVAHFTSSPPSPSSPAPRSPLPARQSLSFDFEGSMVEGIERFVRAWGGRQTPYHAISKMPSRLLRAYRTLIRLTK